MLHTLNTLHCGNFRRTGPLLLLTYLAVHGPANRRDLERLLWPGAQDPANSLRVALHQLKQIQPDAVTGKTTLSTGIPADVSGLLEASGEAALAHPPGAFLQGVEPEALPAPFRGWVTSIHERIARHQRRELLRLAAQANVQRAQQHAERAWALPGTPTPEELHQLLHLADPHSPLHQQVRHTLEAQGHLRPTLHEQTGLVGRQDVLTMLNYWGVQAGGGAAVLSGLGGVGKSATAREALRALHRLGRSVVQGDAEGITSSTDLLRRLGALVAPHHPVDRWPVLRPYLGLKPVVLIDGADHLPDLAGFLQTVRAELPDVRWLVTTRFEPVLTDPGVLSIRLTGLDVPAEHAPPAEVERSPAVQFFLRQAAGQGVRVHVNSVQAARLGQLARAVQGHPMALQQLAVALKERELADLSAATNHWRTAADMPAQVAELTWARLSEADRAQAHKLAPFTEFTVQDAQTFGITLDDLRNLDRHALLDSVPAPDSGGPRYRLHPVFHEFLETREHERRQDACAAHTQHFLTWARHQDYPAPALTGQMGNVLRAVLRGLHDAEQTPSAIVRVAQNHDVRGLHRLGLAWLTDLEDRAALEEAPPAVQAEVRAWRAWFLMREGAYARVLDHLRAFMDSPLHAFALARSQILQAGAIALSVSGLTPPAVNLARQAIAAAHEAADRVAAVSASAHLLWLLMHGGQFDEAHKVQWGLSRQLDTLPETLRVRVQQQLLSARLYLDGDGRGALKEDACEAAQCAHQHGNHITSASLRITEAMACWQLEQWETLADLAQHLIRYTRLHPLVVHEMMAWYLLGTARREQGQHEPAREAVRTGLQLALKHNYMQEILHGILQGALLLPDLPKSRAWAQAAAQDPRTTRLARAVAGRAGLSSEPGVPMEAAGEVARQVVRAL